SAPAERGHRLTLARMPGELPDDLVVTLPTGRSGKAPTLVATLAGLPIPPGALLLPWAPDAPSPTAPSPSPFPLDGGDPGQGEAVFFPEAAKCPTCHKIDGKGGEVGPDLTRPRKADLAWFYRAIAEPGAEIHPEYQAYTIVTKDGRVVAGVVRAVDAGRL